MFLRIPLDAFLVLRPALMPRLWERHAWNQIRTVILRFLGCRRFLLGGFGDAIFGLRRRFLLDAIFL